MSERGFTLVELLMASVISAIVVAGAVALAGAARAALTTEPAALDLVRRLRDAADAVAGAVAGAGGEVGAGTGHAALSALLPVVRPWSATAGDRFAGVVAVRAVQGGRGRLLADQAGAGGSLTLDPAAGACPAAGPVCGFGPGDSAIIADGRGHFDAFVIDAVSEPALRLFPRAPLAHAYRAGALVVAARVERLVLVRQADGAQTLTRITVAGAREPIAEGLTGLSIELWGMAAAPALADAGPGRTGAADYGLLPPPPGAVDPESIYADGTHCLAGRGVSGLRTTLAARPDEGHGLTRLTPADLADGPWCPHADAPDRYDADLFRLRRVDVRLGAEALAGEFRGAAGPWFSRPGTGAQDVMRWVPDRALTLSIRVGR